MKKIYYEINFIKFKKMKLNKKNINISGGKIKEFLKKIKDKENIDEILEEYKTQSEKGYIYMKDYGI